MRFTRGGNVDDDKKEDNKGEELVSLNIFVIHDTWNILVYLRNNNHIKFISRNFGFKV